MDDLGGFTTPIFGLTPILPETWWKTSSQCQWWISVYRKYDNRADRNDHDAPIVRPSWYARFPGRMNHCKRQSAATTGMTSCYCSLIRSRIHEKMGNPLESSQPKSFDPRLQTRISNLIALIWWLLQMHMVKGLIWRISDWSFTGNHRWIWRCDLDWLWVWVVCGRRAMGRSCHCHFVVTSASI